MKRTRKVFTSGAQVLHLWANQTQSDARSRNVFFDGLKCYSYGRHYELGRLVEFNGVRVALINDSGWSATTNKHIHWAYDAVSHLPRFKTAHLYSRRGTHQIETKSIKSLVINAVIRRQGELIDDLFNEFNRRSYWPGAVEFNYTAGKFDQYGYSNEEYVVRSVREFNQSCHTLGLDKYILNVNWAEYAGLYKEHVSICLAKAELAKTPEALAKREKLREQRYQAKIRKAAKDIQLWREGGPITDAVRNIGSTLIRVIDNEVQSSRGARVPLSDALKLFRAIESSSAENGDKVGSFTFNRASNMSNGDVMVTIGCHQILLSEAKTVLNNYNLKAVSNG
jgi:hypothetical protein